KTLIFGLAAAGIGLAGASGASAVPVNGAVIGDLATATDHVTTVQHWRWAAAADIGGGAAEVATGDGAAEVATGDGAAADGEGGELPTLRLAEASTACWPRPRSSARSPAGAISRRFDRSDLADPISWTARVPSFFLH